MYEEPFLLDCASGSTFTSTHSSGDYFDVGQTEIVHTVVDAQGNSSEHIQCITLVHNGNVCDNDIEEPMCGPSDITLTGDTNVGFVTIDFNQYFTDNCDDDLDINGTNISSGFEIGDTAMVPCGETTIFDMLATDDLSLIHI